MRFLGLERPPRWGIVGLVLLVAANVAVFTLMALRPAPQDPYAGPVPAAATGEATASPSPATPEATTPSTPEEPPVLAVYGDGYAAGNEYGGLGAAGWPELVAARTGMELVLSAASRSGYATAGVTGHDFGGLVGAVPAPDAAVTILFGSRNDIRADPGEVGDGVARAIAAVRQASPRTVLVVVGPAWDDAAVPADLLAVRDAVAAAAEESGVTFVDPLQEGWFADGTGLIGTDGVSPSDEGHAYLADRVTPLVDAALATSAAPAE